ncbi:DMT family transporter [Sinosporangium siamense]|uniref:Membrane protein n=1 Tax=Sinosporangium siamense TaxID=1367973 RepID=A0A919V4E6_9ACTN|nr:DMT family transporter [Sinosporangium siamense]GII90453.1 membrane protein [Sinosporangium siamense]
MFIAATAWGTGGAVAAMLYDVSGLGPIAVTFWRFAGAVALLALVALFVRRSHTIPQPAPKDRWRRIAITGTGLAISQATYFASIEFAGLAIGTVVAIGLSPILIAVGAHIFLGERLGRLGLLTTSAALAGLALLVVGGTVNPAPAPLLGLACAVISALGYAAATLANRHSTSTGPAGGYGSAVTSTLQGFAVGMVCLLPPALMEGIWPPTGDMGHTVALMAFLAAVPTALAYLLFFAALSVVRAATASVIALMEPVSATVLAALLLQEHLTVAALAGAAVLLGAVAVLIVGERRAAARRPVAAPEPMLR